MQSNKAETKKESLELKIKEDCYLFNKKIEIKEIRELKDGMVLAYYGEREIVNLSIVKDKEGNFLID